MLPPAPPGDAIGPPEEPPPPPARRRRVWSTALVAFAVVLLLFVIGASFYPVPYYAIAPGSASDVNPLITVPAAHRHQSKGQLLFVTVTESKLVVLEFLRDQFDPNVDILGRAAIEGPKPSVPLTQQNLQEMTDSKQTAIVVALRRLGYQVAEHGKGANIIQVVGKTPASAAGLQVGDTITAVDQTPITTEYLLGVTIRSHQPGQTVTLNVLGANGTARTVSAMLANVQGHAFLGVASQTLDPIFDLPFPVSINSEQIGGPSAGLAFTLALMNVLTSGQLTGGLKIATTGTIEPDGTVGDVGGVAQKTVAVRSSGAVAFLVPPDEYATALANAGKKLKVIKVTTLEDALNALRSLGGNLSGVPEPAPPLDH
jgi:PDZ domain-containing protein